MSSSSKTIWRVIIKVIMAVATTLLGALGVKEAADEQ